MSRGTAAAKVSGFALQDMQCAIDGKVMVNPVQVLKVLKSL